MVRYDWERMIKSFRRRQLFLNHMDAWQVSTIIVALALLIHHALSWRTALLLPAIGGGAWLAFAVNDFYDAPYDALEPNKAARNYFCRFRPGPQTTRKFTAVSVFLLLLFLPFGWRGVAVFTVGHMVMWAYSAPPLRLKNVPVADLMMHAAFVQTFPYAATLLLIEAPWRQLDGLLITILMLASLTAQLEQQARDFEVDRRSGGTFTTRAGLRRTLVGLRILTGVMIGGAAVFVWRGAFPWFVLPYGAIGLPALLHRFLRREKTPRSETLVIVSTSTAFLYTLAIVSVRLWG